MKKMVGTRTLARWGTAALLGACLAAACSSEEVDRDDDGSGASTLVGGSGGSGATGATGGSGATTTTTTTNTSEGGSSACGHAGEAEPGDVAGITAAHNAIRCSLPDPGPVPPLEWSSALAAVAQAWADGLAQSCGLNHSGGPYGENLYMSSVSRPPEDVVQAWASELDCFTFGSFPDCCSCICGHYTQIVWRNSVHVGCAKATCNNGGEVWVCNYDPPGNYVSQMPY